MRNDDVNINVQLKYLYNDAFDYETYLERIDLDKEREIDLKSGRGFVISPPKTIKKDLKDQEGIFSSRYGSTLQDLNSLEDKYRCKCGMTRGAIYHGMICNCCGTMVKFIDDDMSIFGWIILEEPYFVIHPNLYRSLEALIGATKLDNILGPVVTIDKDGNEVRKEVKKDELFAGIGMIEFRERIDEILNYYVNKGQNKRKYYDDIMKHKNILFTRSIPVFTALLRPSKFDNAKLRYEKTNENYNIINKLVSVCNNDNLKIFRKKKGKLEILYNIQTQFNNIYIELKDILSKKKGDIRSALGGRYSFSERSVITQGTDLMPNQIRLPYHGLCELLQQVIINILIKTYNFSYADAYKYWYKAQLGYNEIVYQIIDNLIKDSDEGLSILINRNPTIQYGSVLSMKCVGINKDYTMSIPLQVLKLLAADFDGDTLNILLLLNKSFVEMADKILSPKVMFVSRNDGRFNNDMNFARDTIINANSMKSLCKYSEDEIDMIKRCQATE